MAFELLVFLQTFFRVVQTRRQKFFLLKVQLFKKIIPFGLEKSFLHFQLKLP